MKRNEKCNVCGWEGNTEQLIKKAVNNKITEYFCPVCDIPTVILRAIELDK